VIVPDGSTPRATPHPSEKALSTAVAARLRRSWGAVVLNVHGGGTSQAAGHPDLIGCLLGRFLAIELKQPGKVPTPLQMKRLRDWAAAGALAGWATTEAEVDALVARVDEPGWINPQLADAAATVT
jgi:hypothetical protein